MAQATPDYSPELSLDDLLVQVADTHRRNPSIGKIYQAKLKEGPQKFRIATVKEILVAETGKLHHYSLEISSYKRKKDGWLDEKERSISIESGKDDEINKFTFYGAFYKIHFQANLENIMF